MKTKLCALPALLWLNLRAAFFPRLLILDNETAAAEVEAEFVFTIDNASPGVLRLPFGQYPKGDLMQVINKRTCTDMKRVLDGGESTWDWCKSVLKTGFSKLWGQPIPVVIGHPNHDAPVYGSIKRMEVLDNEAVFYTDWKPEGEALVSGAAPKLCAWSPRFKVRTVDNQAFPFAIVHAGLTNRPNIPGSTISSMDNEGGVEPGALYTIEDLDNSDAVLGGGLDLDNDCCYVPMAEVNTLRKKLYLEQDATLEQVNAAMVVRMAEFDKAKVDLANLQRLLSEEQAKAVNLLDSNNKLKGDVATSDNEAKELKTGLVDACLKALQGSGRLKPADFLGELNRIKDLDNEKMLKAITEIASRPPVLKTLTSMPHAARQGRTATLDNEGRRAAEAANAKMAEVKRLTRQLMASDGLDEADAYRRAFAQIMN